MSVLRFISFLLAYVIITLSFPTISQAIEKAAEGPQTCKESQTSATLPDNAVPIKSISSCVPSPGAKKIKLSGAGTLVIFPLTVETVETQQPSSLRLYCGARSELIKNRMEIRPGNTTGISQKTDDGTLPTISLMGGLGIDISETVSLEFEGGLDRKSLEDYTVLVTLTFRGW